jgi:hypothetical protein
MRRRVAAALNGDEPPVQRAPGRGLMRELGPHRPGLTGHMRTRLVTDALVVAITQGLVTPARSAITMGHATTAHDFSAPRIRLCVVRDDRPGRVSRQEFRTAATGRGGQAVQPDQ